jgi:hypothetical protein
VASPVVQQNRGVATAAAASSVSRTWSADTVAGDRLLAIVSFEANGVSNISVTPADTLWKVKNPPNRVVRQAAGVDELVIIVYEMINAPARLAANAEVFNLSNASFATLELLRISGADTIVANALTPTTVVGSGLSIACSNPGTPTVDSLAIFIAANGNPASTQTVPGGWTLLDDNAPASTGSDRERTDIYVKNVGAGVAVGSATTTISGATNRNFAGTIIVIPAPSGAISSDVNVVQGKVEFPAQGTSTSIAWDQPTVAGNRLMLVVGINENNVETTPTVPGAWGSPIDPPTGGMVERFASGLPFLSIRVYEILNAASRSGSEAITFDQSVYPMLGLIELNGSSISLAPDKESHGTGAGVLADTGATGTTTITDGIAIAIEINGNVTSLSPEAADSYGIIDSGNSGGSGNGAKISGGIYSKAINVAGAQQLRIDIGGGITRSWAALVLAIPASTQVPPSGTGGSPFFTNLDDGRMHRALSLHYGSPVTSLTLAQQTANMFDIGIATYDDSGGQWNDFLDDILAIKPSFKAGFYGKSAQYSGSVSTFPHGYYAYDSGGNPINTFSNNIWVMQPDGTGSYTDPRGFTSATWKQWVARDHKKLMDHENARWPSIDPITLVYGDSMGTSSYKGTQVSPTDGHTYTSAQWIALVRSIGDAMKTEVGANVMVVGNGLTSGPNYFNASTPTSGLMDHVDMGLCENWMRNNFAGLGTFMTEAQWKNCIDMIIDCNVNRQKACWVVTNLANYTAGNPPAGWVAPTAAQIEQWIRLTTCSYFMGQRGACVYEFQADSRNPNQGLDHAYWNTRLGAPLEFVSTAAGHQVGGSTRCYHRLFTAGLVLVNPTSGNLTYVADRDYKDAITGTTVATGATITLAPHTGQMFLTTSTTSGTPNQSGPTVTWDSPSPSLWGDTATKTVQVTITDPDGVATPGHLFQDGVDKGAMTEVGSGTTTRVFTKTGVVFPDGTASTLSVTVADNHASPLTTVSQHQFEYVSTPVAPPVIPELPPPPVTPTPTLGSFAGHLYDEIAPLDFVDE